MNQLQTTYRYQVGGALKSDFPAYVRRESDLQLYAALKAGEFCYVLNSRQMGKSSLMVRTKILLEAEGIACAVLDFSAKDSQKDRSDLWYNGIINRLNLQLGLQVDVRTWLKERDYLSPVERLEEFIETVMLPQIAQPIVIFIDEIDSTLNLPFTDDFFALIRSCYNKRDNPDYRRLTFALLGVATPTELIGDAKRTPFNIGKAIDLKGFRLEEALPLAAGLALKAEDTQAVLGEIIKWTGGQPFLTQRLCQMVVDSVSFIPSGQEATQVERLARTRIIQNWESQDEQEHLKTIKNRMLRNEKKAGYLLELYRQIRLAAGEFPSQNTSEERELQLTGLVVKRGERLRVYNPIYAEVFNEGWIDGELGKLRPYAESFRAWVDSEGKDESRLLRGKTLEKALEWGRDKNLSYEDKQFLAASQQQKIEEEIQAEKAEAELERERKDKEAAERAQAKAEGMLTKARRRGAAIVALALVVAVGSGWYAVQKADEAKKQTEIANIAEQEAKKQTEIADNATQEANKQTEIADRAKQVLQTTQKALKSGREELSKVQEQATSTQKKYNQVKTDLQTKEQQVKHKEAELNTTQERQQQAELKAQNFQKEVQSLQDQKAQVQNQLNQSRKDFDRAKEAKNEAETAAQNAREEKKRADLLYANINKEIQTAQDLVQLAGDLQDKGKNDDSNEALRQAGLSFKVPDHNLKQALLLAATSQAYLSLENQKEAQKLIEESQTYLAKAVKDPKTSEQIAVLVYFTQGQVSQDQKQTEDARTFYQKAFTALKDSQYDPYNPNISPKILSEGQVESVHRELLKLLDKGQSQEVEQSLKNHYAARTEQYIKELETLLKNKNWREADSKTYNALVSSARSQDFGDVDWDNVSCPALRQIDKLWLDNSKGMYGFSVQSDIYIKTGNPIGGYNEEAYRRFGQEVGWNVNNRWIDYSELWWGEPKQRGHLPIWVGGFGFRFGLDWLYTLPRCGL